MPMIPEKPVDGYTVSGFTVEQDREHCPVVVTLKYIYHVRTPWAKIAEQAGTVAGFKGADLVDQWQVIHTGKFVGRMQGWDQGLKAVRAGFFFRSRKGAVISALHMIDDGIRDHQVRIDQLTKARRALTKGAKR
jgi:hypothetical protein